jgi:hypothetical protein
MALIGWVIVQPANPCLGTTSICEFCSSVPRYHQAQALPVPLQDGHVSQFIWLR